MAALDYLPIGTDTPLQVTARDTVADDFINNATVTATVRDQYGQPVGGQSWPITLVYVAESDGVYEGLLEDGMQLSAGRWYTVEITIDAGADLIASLRLTRQARHNEG
jgi:hypothetical protein